MDCGRSVGFLSYFNSDRPLKDQLKDPKSPQDRPDLAIFELGLGFQNTDVSQPITIIEFKRPKLDNYTLEKNPITQVRSYVEQMRDSGVAQKFDGETLRHIDDDTPFYCHIIADATPSLKRMMRSFGPFHQKAGSGSYYCWDEAYRILSKYLRSMKYCDLRRSETLHFLTSSTKDSQCRRSQSILSLDYVHIYTRYKQRRAG